MGAMIIIINHHLPSNYLREDNDFREAIILNISHLKSNKLNIGFLSVPNLAP